MNYYLVKGSTLRDSQDLFLNLVSEIISDGFHGVLNIKVKSANLLEIKLGVLEINLDLTLTSVLLFQPKVTIFLICVAASYSVNTSD